MVHQPEQFLPKRSKLRDRSEADACNNLSYRIALASLPGDVPHEHCGRDEYGPGYSSSRCDSLPHQSMSCVFTH